MRDKLSKEDQVRLNAKIRAYNTELLGYAEGLLEATDLSIASLDEVPKKQWKKKKAYRKADTQALIKAELAELKMYFRHVIKKSC